MIGIGKAGLGAVILAAMVAACSSAGSSQSVAGATQAASAAASSAAASSSSGAGGYYGNGSSSASASMSESGSSGSGSTSGATVEAKSAGGSTVLVAGSNGMTVYTFSQDSANSGKSNCTGGCASTWPPLTVSGGAAPTAGSGVSGKLGTIKRDDGSMQVTYNGLPLYFFHGDTKPGDTNGNYTGWNLVKP